MEEKKEYTIHDLYKREKLIRKKDDQEREIQILLVKMTQKDRHEGISKYQGLFDEETSRLRKREEKSQIFSAEIKNSKKEDLVDTVIASEKRKRLAILDLYPLKDELKKEEKEKQLNEELERWEKDRRSSLAKENRDILEKMLMEDVIESNALVTATRKFNYYCLSKMCLHPKTKEKLFKNEDEVLEIQDPRVINWLLEELANFRAFEEEKKIREIVASSDFSETGSSQKPSTDSQSTTAKT